MRDNFLSLAATRQRHVGSNPNPETLDPDRWTDEFAFLSGPGDADIQLNLFYDYRANVARYPAWDDCGGINQPRWLSAASMILHFWLAEVAAYQRDLPQAEVHIINAGHFASYEKPDEIARLIGDFLK